MKGWISLHFSIFNVLKSKVKVIFLLSHCFPYVILISLIKNLSLTFNTQGIMKKIALIVAVLGFHILSAQKLNDKGLYVNGDEGSPLLANNELFNGILSQTKDGIKSDFTVKEGVIDGPASYFYASGKLMEVGTFTNGQKDQKWTRYNENGSVSAIAFYHVGKKTGTWVVFDDNGKKRFEMNYNDGQKTGVWTSWDENGAVASVKDYSKVN